ncbi:peroxisomal protein [Coprinellus micaceus]|uniref:Peroxisomal protein n=1 Tax=Coprinellus micaceus TaxID=71717 RepID=A0A4Y7SXM5_COPMI|nr:peroxisomal protein [Coprinellus micaceus]
MSMALLNEIIANPAYHDYLAILKGARNGFVYGVKVRFPHALVMSILFGRGDLWTIYKSLLLLQKKMNKGKERSLDTFIAGLIGGYVVFGERNAVNEQIVLYVVSRVPTAGYKTAPDSALASSAVKPLPPNSKYFTVFAALSWGAVMWLFRHRGETIQPGMFNSMKYLYLDSNAWKDLRTLFWHNT